MARTGAEPAGVASQPVRQANSQLGNGQQAVQPTAAIAAPQQPFQLNAAEAADLNALLLRWQAVSQATKTLECTFQRWHFDMFAAPAGIHATKSVGIVKYAAPDKGLFRVDQLMFFKGMQGGKPQYGPQQGKFGEHWVCNGQQLIEFDRTLKQCRIENLPPAMQGQKIFNSPLPFVFNLDAQQIQERYWVREVKAPKEGIHLIEAWPKRQDDRAQYKLVQIALAKETFLPQALIMYAPNFNVKTAQKFDHYEFSEVKRNSIGNRFAEFMKSFIPEKPPANWQIVKSNLLEPVKQAAKQTQADHK
jgi:TIGR03009 family protein